MTFSPQPVAATPEAVLEHYANVAYAKYSDSLTAMTWTGFDPRLIGRPDGLINSF